MYGFIDRTDNKFSEIVGKEIYVDKTGLLKHLNRFIENGERQKKEGKKESASCDNLVSISRPSGFGKSSAVEMIEAYYSCALDTDDNLFEPYEIAKSQSYRKHLHKYHVLSVSMKRVRKYSRMIIHGPRFREVMNLPNNTSGYGNEWQPAQIFEFLILENLRKQFPGAVNDDCRSLSEALSLIGWVTERKFVIIIDDWDSIIRHNAYESVMADFYRWYLCDLFRQFDEKRMLALGFITGVLPFSSPEGDNMAGYSDTMIEPGIFSPYFGFSENEVKRLYKQYPYIPVSKRGSKDDQESVYGLEFSTGKGKTKKMRIYLPRDVIHRCLPQYVIPIWSDKNLLNHIWDPIVEHYSTYKKDFRRLFDGKKTDIGKLPSTVHLNDLEERKNVYSLLVHAGYLGYRHGKLYFPCDRVLKDVLDRYDVELSSAGLPVFVFDSDAS